MRRSTHDTESEEHLSPVDFRMPTGAELERAKAEVPTWACLCMIALMGFASLGWAVVFAAAGVLSDMTKHAIDSGAARHNAKTGDLEWIVVPPPTAPGTAP